MFFLCILAILGIFSLLNLTYLLQLKWGNWLYKNANKSWLRKIWWSEYDFYRNYDDERILLELLHARQKMMNNKEK